MTGLAPAYERFAYAYDRIMYNVDYQRWADYIQSIFNQQGESPRTILDVACGTAALSDNYLSCLEIELLRAIADSIGTPIPPFVFRETENGH